MNTLEELMSAALTAPEDRRDRALRVLRGEVAEAPSPRSEGPLLLGMGASARYLGVGRATLWRILQTGRLEKVEVLPNSFRMRRSDLDDFVRGKSGRSACPSRRSETAREVGGQDLADREDREDLANRDEFVASGHGRSKLEDGR